MSNPVTIASFTSNFDMKYILFKEMLDEAGIRYMLVNEITSTVDGIYRGSPTNIGIELRVMEEDVAEAIEIFNSIK
ncbi:putative signal transducing protein [Maribellus mangrovi]|uniref:putative signal transducing protein n=1 Tax=Maribellus mangrovi TaxID=3133146 RepID=UPI0030EB55F3